MNIDRNNYQVFFMLYADDELNAAQKKTVDLFLAANPDLQQELELFRAFKLDADETIVFENKQALLKQTAAEAGVNSHNCETYFVLYADNELTTSEKNSVETFVTQNTQLKHAFDLVQLAKLQPDLTVLYEDKESLYRYEPGRVVPLVWWRMAAAAAVILFIGGVLWLSNVRTIQNNNIVHTNTVVPQEKLPAVIPAQPLALPGTNNSQAEKKSLATNRPQNESNPLKHIPHSAIAKKKANRNHNSNPSLKQVPEDKETMAVVQANEINAASVAVITAPAKKADNRKPLIAAAQQPLPDQPTIILNPDENDRIKASFTAGDDDNVEVLNTSVNTKSSLRGFLRKAGRLIARKTGNDKQDGDRKGILIGGFEIAVR